MQQTRQEGNVMTETGLQQEEQIGNAEEERYREKGEVRKLDEGV